MTSVASLLPLSVVVNRRRWIRITRNRAVHGSGLLLVWHLGRVGSGSEAVSTVRTVDVRTEDRLTSVHPLDEPVDRIYRKPEEHEERGL